MMTLSALLALCEAIHRWIPLIMDHLYGLWCFLIITLNELLKKTVAMPMILDVLMLMERHSLLMQHIHVQLVALLLPPYISWTYKTRCSWHWLLTFNSRDSEVQYDTSLQSTPNGTNRGRMFIYQTIHHETCLYIECSPMNVQLPQRTGVTHLWDNIDRLMQERRNSIANALDLCLSCTNPWIWKFTM